MAHEKLRELIVSADEVIDLQWQKHFEIDPVWVMMNSKGEGSILPEPRLSNKAILALAMQQIFQKLDIVLYIHICEAWVIVRPPETAESYEEAEAAAEEMLHKYGSLEHAPGRKEMITFSGEDEWGSMLARREIIRPENGDPTLGPLIIDEADVAGGQLMGLLPQRGSKQ